MLVELERVKHDLGELVFILNDKIIFEFLRFDKIWRRLDNRSLKWLKTY